ncbi:MAG: hypothetical protein GEV12_18805 [Micromonosporaceae bacterium]|nr:hypothetical protein [Micromonosporaceae bacterium]
MTGSVFLLWHVHHVAGDEAGMVKHFDSLDDHWADEVGGDDVKLLGAYSSWQKAVDRMREAMLLNGFRSEPRCFSIDEYVVDNDYWTEGFS